MSNQTNLPPITHSRWEDLTALAPAAVLLISLTITVTIWHWKNEEEELRGQNRFNTMVLALIGDINDRITHFEQLLRVGRGLIAHDKDMPALEWNTFIENISIDKEYPGLDSIAVVVPVKSSERHAFEAAQRFQHPGFHIVPDGIRAEYFINRIVEPERSKNAIGYDVGTSPQRRQTLERSRDTGDFSLSDPIKLITDKSSEPALVMYLPAYRGKDVPPTAEERQKALSSWVGVAFRVPGLMQDVMAENVGLDIDIYFGNAESASNKLFDSIPPESDVDEANKHPTYSITKGINVADRIWVLNVRSTPIFESEFVSATPKILLISGIILSISLFFTAKMLRDSRTRALKLATRMTRELRASECKFRSLIETQVDMVLRLGLDGRLTFVNERTCSVIGRSSDELIGTNWKELVNSEDHEATALEIASAFSHPDRRVLVTNRILTAAGERWYAWEGVGVFSDEEHLTEVQAVGRDITQNKISEKRIGELLDFNNKIISECPIGILAYNSYGDCALSNDAAAKLVGWSVDLLRTKNLWTITPWKKAGILNACHEAMSGEAILRRDVYICTTFGRSFWADYYFIPFLITGEPHLLVIINDVTSWHEAEDALSEAKQRAETADRAKSEFLAMMSHELRTPLNSILGFSELIRDTDFKIDDGAKSIEYATYINTSGQHLLGILNDILDLAKIEAGKMKIEQSVVSMSSILNDISRIFIHKASKHGLTLATYVDATEPLVWSDERVIRQVLFNLLSNAIKFTAQGGIILRMTTLERSELTLTFQIEVEDTGIGIAPDKQQLLFQPFTQLGQSSNRRFDGTGLGLVITKRLVEMLGGTIGVDSQIGKGSRFWFTLPLRISDNNETKSAMAVSTIAQRLGRQLRILMAEDNRLNQLLVLSIMQKGGHAVEMVGNGRAAVDAVIAKDFDLVLMDIQMPEMDGQEATRMIRCMPSPKNQIPIIALTADAMPEHRERYLASGINALIEKPISSDLLIQTIETIISNKGLVA